MRETKKTMCSIGDIIVVRNYITEDGTKSPRHSFIVVEDECGEIYGLSYDFVANVMSSIKSEEHKAKKLRFIENLFISSDDMDVDRNNGKDAYIKADQLYYFDKSKTDYFVLGKAEQNVIDELMDLLELLEKKGLLKQVIANLKTEQENPGD